MLNFARFTMRVRLKLLTRQTGIMLSQIRLSQLLQSIETSKLPCTKTAVTLCKGLAIYAYIVRVTTRAATFVYLNTRLPLICKIAICFLLTYIAGMAIRRSETRALIIYGLAL